MSPGTTKEEPGMPRDPREVGVPIGISLERRSKSLILDLFGAYARPLGNWFAVADLVTLMGVLGVEERPVRSAVSRMRRTGLLDARARDGVRGYSLAPGAMPMMERGDRRIFSTREPARLEEGWIVVVASVGEAVRDQRYQLRKRLTWLGFGNLAKGVWIAPRRTADELRAVLDQFGLTGYVEVFHSSYLGFGSLEAVVRRAWDLEWLRALYADFLAIARPMLSTLDVESPSDERAFVDYTVVLHEWRRLPYLDPGLPREVLPPDWEGRTAADAFFALRDRLEERASRFVAEITRASE
jgi:phenylacetic acid degradation operon negative regulatory protein